MTLGHANEVIALLEGASKMIISTETLLAKAYQMLGKPREAKAVLQVGIYHHMGLLLGALTDYLSICAEDPKRFEETYRRALAVADAFDLEKLHPAILMKFNILAAQGYTMLKNTDKALEILEEYTRLVTGDIYPLKLKGDGYFDLIDEWIEELDLGGALPRDAKIVRQSMVESIVNNPVFNALAASGTTIFLCTHQLRYAQEICTTYGLMNEGSLLASGTLETLRTMISTKMKVRVKASQMPDGIEYLKTGENTYNITVNSEEDIPSIVNGIVGAGGDIYHVSAAQMSLEEIYFSLIDINNAKKKGVTL